MIEAEIVDVTPENLERYEAVIEKSLMGKKLSFGASTAFSCIRLCFGELHVIEHKFETVAGEIKNGEFNLILEEMQWHVEEYDQVLVHDQMDIKEVDVLIGFVIDRVVKSVSFKEGGFEIEFDGEIKLIAKTDKRQNAEEQGIRWYFSKGEDWLMTNSLPNYNLTGDNLAGQLETSLLKSVS